MIVGWVQQTDGKVTIWPSRPRWSTLSARRTNRDLLCQQVLHRRSHARLHREGWFVAFKRRRR